ncbi:condensation domain-containing protein [Photorhabdus sp. RM96S]|uniref:condensation domain-containing protein n=1 Tax=Photorhabdus sp. RM96S TaxID=3342822 RepID=UPI0036DC57B7
MTNTNNSPNLDSRIDGLSDKRKRLLAQLLGNSDEGSRAYEAPQNETEGKLANIWQKAFNRPSIGRHENYFALGGDSLSSIKITAQASLLGLGIKMQDLIKHPTIAQLAVFLSESGADTQTTIPSTRKEQPRAYIFSEKEQASYPLTPMQFGMLYHCRMEPNKPLYISQLLCEFDGEFNAERFHSALLYTIQRYPGLRAGFPSELIAERSYSVSHFDALPQEVFEVDNKEHSRADVVERAKFERLKGIDVEKPPLMRFKILNIGSSQFTCIWTLHHLILDGWSQEIVLEALFEAYARLSQGQALSAQVVSYPRWNPSFHRAQTHKAETFWKTLLAGYRPLSGAGKDNTLLLSQQSFQSAFSIDEPAGQNHEFNLELNYNEFPILAFSEQQGITPCAVMLSAFSLALFKTEGRMDSLIGTILSGRSGMLGEEVNSAVGNFINCLPIRCKAEDTTSLLEFYASCKDHYLNLVEFEASPINQIQEWLGMPNLSKSLNTLFVFENFKGAHEFNQAGLPFSIENVRFNIMEHYPLVMTVIQTAASIRVVMRVRSTLVQEAKVQQLWSHFCRVFEAKLWLKQDQSVGAVLLTLGE